MGIFDFLKPKDITVDQNCEQVKTLNQDMQIQTNGSFEFLVDDVFYINDRGIVVTGKILSGSIKLGDNVIIFPEGIGTIVTGIEQFRKKLEFAQAGELVGISLAGINKKQIHKGNKLIK
jgi:selenocysteine-specific elongation factor